MDAKTVAGLVVASAVASAVVTGVAMTMARRGGGGRRGDVAGKGRVLFGVLGGLGPQATAWFYADGVVRGRVRVFEACAKLGGGLSLADEESTLQRASTAPWTRDEALAVKKITKDVLEDQDHVPLFMYSAAHIPPRPAYILGASKIDPAPVIADCLASLAGAGATHAAVVCSTAHYFLEDAKRVLAASPNPAVRSIHVIDMIQLALAFVARRHPRETMLGLLATEATIRTRIYDTEAAKFNSALRLVSPLNLSDGQHRQQQIQDAIFAPTGIKRGFDRVREQPEARHSLKLVLRESVALAQHIRRARASESTSSSSSISEPVVILLGCTELPILVNDTDVSEWKRELLTVEECAELDLVEFVDPGRVLADFIVREELLARLRRT